MTFQFVSGKVVEDLVIEMDQEINDLFDTIVDGCDPEDLYESLESLKEILRSFPVSYEVTDLPGV